MFEAGEGAPLLWLHGSQGVNAKQEFVPLFSARRCLIVPSHPGFGRSGLPDWLDSLDKVDIVGCSIGGWIAAEMATKVPERVSRLAMVGPVGVKVGSADKLDIPDIFAMPQADVNKLVYHDPSKAPDIGKMPDDELAIMFRNRETTALLVWEPWMHSTKLKHRLHRVKAPALFIRGASDGLVSADYLKTYAGLLPNARTSTIAAAGHAPHLEQADALASAVLEFLEA